jgi:transposase InsO family protein
MRVRLLTTKIYANWVRKEELERWRVEYNQIRPHSSLGYRPPAPEAIYPEIQRIDQVFVN